MAYGNDVTVYVDDQAGQFGAQPSPAPWWLSPDVDIVGHSGEAVQGVNDVQVRVHAHEEPILDTRIIAEVYVGGPGFVLSPTTGTVRIDPQNLLFRPSSNFPGPEPVADEPGATLTFQWTPSASSADINGPGHRCLIVRAFPDDVSPPTTPFDVPNEQHEAQHNIEILTTTTTEDSMEDGGRGTEDDPRRREKGTGMWWERFMTLATKKEAKSYVLWAFDPRPSKQLVAGLQWGLPKGFEGFSKDPPSTVTLEGGDDIDPNQLLKDKGFVQRAGLGGKGLFTRDRLLAATRLSLSPTALSEVVLRFDHSNLEKYSAVVLHGAQFGLDGTREGGMTVVALAPTDP